jgi:hypothetical protein
MNHSLRFIDHSKQASRPMLQAVMLDTTNLRRRRE